MREHAKLCRLCTSPSQNVCTTPLFERSQRATLRRIFLLTGVKLKNLTNIPTLLCSDCETELNRAYEFRERCITAQTYFTSSEYKSHIAHTRKNNMCSGNKTAEAVPTIAKVELTSDGNEYETGYVEIQPERNIKSDTKVAALVESELVALYEDEIDHAIYDDSETETTDESRVNPTHKLASVNKRKYENEIHLQNPIQEYEAAENANFFPVGEVVTSEHPAKELKQTNNSKSSKSNKTKLKKEQNNKAKIYICDQCGNNFKYRTHFYSHIKRHTGIKPVQCEVCPNKFFTQGELKRHMRRHTGERPFACQYCQRRFTDYSTRVKHERIHTNERPFQCPQCDKAFTTSYVLKNHILVHTGERSFKCESCNKSFQTQNHLIVHTRSLSHKQNVEREQQIASTSDEYLITK